MTHIATPAEYHANGIITAAEQAALELRYTNHLSVRNTALALGISRSSTRERLTNALRKIARHEEAQAA